MVDKDSMRRNLWGFVLLPLLAVNLGLVSASVVRHSRSNQHDKTAHVDSTVELACDLTYEYRDDLEWKKVNGRMSDNARSFDGKLTISGVTEQDAGEYECFTDYGKSSIVKLTVPSARSSPRSAKPANFITEFERELDTDVELFCALSRGNENEIKWRKIGGEISEYNREYDGKVLIYYLSAEDSGEYECYLPTGESRRVTLKVIAPKEYENEYDASSHSSEHHVKPQAPVHQEPQHRKPSSEVIEEEPSVNFDKETEAGENIELACKYTVSNPENLKWKKLNGKMSDYAREHQGKLYIFYSAVQDTGDYECYLPNGQSAVVKLTVNGAQFTATNKEVEEVASSEEPALEEEKETRVEKKIENYDQEAELDSNVQLSCELTEGHESELKWKRLEGSLSEYARDHHGKLYIYYVNKNDNGEYECFLPSGESRRVRLTVKGGAKADEPEVSASEDNKNYDLEVNLNEHAELDCKYRKGNENTLKWKRLDGEINSYAREHQGKLYVYYATHQDAGMYECFLPSGESSQVKLSIKGAEVPKSHSPVQSYSHESVEQQAAPVEQPIEAKEPEQTTEDQQVLEVEGSYDEVADIDSNIELSCRYTHQNPNGLQWKKMDGPLSQYARVHEGKLFIYYISEQDEGEYECVLPDGSLSRVKLTVNKPNKSPLSPPAPSADQTEAESKYDVAYASSRENHDKQAEVNENIELTCGLSETDEESLQWRKINGKLSDYSRPYGGKLYIYYLKQEDAGDYECYLPNGRSDRVKLTVSKKASSEQAPKQSSQEKVQETSYDKEADLNTIVELTCKFSQSHSSNLRWRKRGGELNYNVREYQGKLMLYYINEENLGEYECYLPNGQSSVVKLSAKDSNQDSYQGYQRSDDSYAVRAYLSKNELSLRYGSSDENTCTGMTNGDSLEIKWYNSRGQLLRDSDQIKITTSLTSQEPLTKVSVFTIISANSNSADTVECRVIVGRKTESAKFKISLDTQPRGQGPYQSSQELVSATKIYNIFKLAGSRRQHCGVSEATCANGQCIPRSGLCDGNQDCQDGSDENNCGPDASGCQPNERACRNGVCKEKIWFCDGEKDCEDGSDEESCPPARPGETCKADEFECKSRNQCVKKGFVCDNEFDCNDKSDEIGCEKPRAITFPIRDISVRQGETFTIECQAGGFPEPYINWRKNWGHICKEPRCTTTNRNGFGTLTVRNAQPDDAGAYSCEAMNSQGREFVGPDTIVSVEESYEQQEPAREDLRPCGETSEYRGGCGQEEPVTEPPVYEERRCGDSTTPDEYRGGCGEREEPPPPPPEVEESRCGDTTPSEYRGCGHEETPPPPPPQVEEESRPCGYEETTEAAEQRSGCGREEPTYPPPPEVHEEESRPCGYQETTEAAEQRSGCGHEEPTYPPPPEVHEEESRPCGYQDTTTEAAEQRSGCGREGPTYPPPPEVHEEEQRPCGYHETTTPAQSSSCFCYNHADECDCHGQCRNCQHNTHGAHCEMCLPGFYGDATRGTPYDCTPVEPVREEESRPCGYSRCGEEQPEPEPQREEESRPCGSGETTTEAAEQRSGCGGEEHTQPPPPEVHEEESRPCGYQEDTTTEAAEQRSGCGREEPTYPPPPEVHEEESRPCGYQEDTTTEAAEQRSGCGQAEPTHPPEVREEESRPCGYQEYTTPAQSSSCFCNNHSDKCTCGGYCYECQHNTEGRNCERCAFGYYGDATAGTPYDCQPIHRRNSQLLSVESSRDSSYSSSRNSCDPDGTAKDLGHSCRCKSGVIGKYCDQCAPKHFNMLRQQPSKASKRGCLACFCNGLDVECNSSDLKYEAIRSSFAYSDEDWKISDKFTRLQENVDVSDEGIEFARFDEYRDTDLYFIPSRKFGGNKLASYGGYLNFSIEYEGVFDNFKQLEIRISGNRINIYHVYDATLKPGSKYDISLHLVEYEFKRYGDDGRVDRDHFLMALQNIELIMIRASFVRQQSKVRLSDVSLQHAEPNGSLNSAISVEVCRCPMGYAGNSCEDCAPGYRRAKIGFYLGLCEPEYFKY